MGRVIFFLLTLTSCSMGTIKSGGEDSYSYHATTDYQAEDLKTLAANVVTVEKRDPQVGKLETLFSSKQPPIKRVGVVVFETMIENTRAGLTEDDLIYPSAQGKQLITEKFLSLWEEGFGLMNKDFQIVSMNEIKNSKAMGNYGLEVEDFIKTNRASLDPDDIAYVERGKKASMATVMNPRDMRDLSLLLVPASELMGGPKWSEHQKLFVNEISKELNLDAVIVVLSEINWTKERKEKLTGNHIPEELRLKIKASTLIPFSSYHTRLENLKNDSRPGTNLCYRTHKAELRIPVKIDVPEDEKNFETIEKNLLSPMFTAYRDLSMMTIASLMNEWEKSYTDGK